MLEQAGASPSCGNSTEPVILDDRIRAILLVLMLTLSDSPATWIRVERTQLGMSTRDLARLAGVAYPTISRIENGHEQPRWSTLQKIFVVLGYSFAPATDEREQPRLADLSEAWSKDATGGEHPDWTRLRAFADRMTLQPELIARGIFPEPPPSRSVLMNVLLAAMAEKIADDAGITCPRWTRRRSGLQQPWSPAVRQSKRDAAASTAPIQFIRRGLMIPASTIWRERSQKLGVQRT